MWRESPAVRQPFGQVTVQWLAVGREIARVPGAVRRPFLTLADRNGNGSDNGRGSHEDEKSDGNDEIVHGRDQPIPFCFLASQREETTEAVESAASNYGLSLVFYRTNSAPGTAGSRPNDPVKLSATKELVRC